MKIKKIELKIFEYLNSDELPEQDWELIFCAREAGLNAYAPYSGFRVGAAVLLENGEIISANNQENAAFPSGLCAERIALFYAAANFPSVTIKAMAVSILNNEGMSMEIAKPCGSCRQVISEYEDLSGKPIRIILDGRNVINVVEGIDNLLPLRFKKKDLK
jgi:cytidine deaminase